MRRIVTAGIIILGVSIAIFSYWASCIIITCLICLGLYEFFKMVENKGIKVYKYFGIAVGLAIPLSVSFGFELTKNWELLFIISALVSLILLQFSRRNNFGAIVDIATTIFGILYISWFFSFLIKIRNLPNGLGLLASILIMTKMGDIGAYLVGSRFGRTPLLPRISPKKTWEGACGGILFSVMGSLASKAFVDFSYLRLLILGVFIGAIGQLGDLSESLFKRDCQVKDSGKIFNEMGGVLDVIDSLLFSAPVFYLYVAVR